MKILSKGKVNIDNKCKPYEYKDTKVIFIDLITKRAEVAIGSHNDIPIIFLSPTEDSVHLSKSKNEFTEILFPEYKGWTILQANVSKYNLNITFIKFKDLK